MHLTLDLGGQAKFGPDLQWHDSHDPHSIDYTANLRLDDGFYEAVRRYWPALPDNALQPGYRGVRPEIDARRQRSVDFRIDGPSVYGVSGLINLFGIESPRLPNSIPIAERVTRLEI